MGWVGSTSNAQVQCKLDTTPQNDEKIFSKLPAILVEGLHARDSSSIAKEVSVVNVGGWAVQIGDGKLLVTPESSPLAPLSNSPFSLSFDSLGMAIDLSMAMDVDFYSW